MQGCNIPNIMGGTVTIRDLQEKKPGGGTRGETLDFREKTGERERRAHYPGKTTKEKGGSLNERNLDPLERPIKKDHSRLEDG